MKRTLLISFLLLATALMAAPVLAQEGEAATSNELPKQEMQMYQIVLAKRGPNWKGQGSEGGMDVRMQVVQAVKDAAKDGVLVSAGLVSDETDVEFIFIFDIETKGEVHTLIMNSANIKNGFFKAEIYSYFGPKGLVFKR